MECGNYFLIARLSRNVSSLVSFHKTKSVKFLQLFNLESFEQRRRETCGDARHKIDDWWISYSLHRNLGPLKKLIWDDEILIEFLTK